MELTAKTLLKFTATICFISSCIGELHKDGHPEISTDLPAVTMEAESENDTLSLTCNITISSNRSWGLNIMDASGNPVDWVRASVMDNLNLSGLETDTEVTLSFDENHINRIREASMTITSEECEKTVPITQKAAVYYLRAEKEGFNLPCGADTIAVDVFSNTQWTARIKEGATADAELLTESGTFNSEIKVAFAENEDLQTTKTAVIVLSAEDCPDIEIVFNQDKSLPYFEIDTENSITAIKPQMTQTRIFFKTNSDWSISIAEGATIGNLSLSKENGDKTDRYLDISFDRPLTPEAKMAAIDFTVPGLEETRRVTLTQTGLAIELSFASQPFAEKLPTSKITTSEETTCTLSRKGQDYRFIIGPNSTVRYLSSASCIILDKGYIALPAVEGLRLTGVSLTCTATDKSFLVSSDKAGKSVVSGGKKVTLANGESVDWVLAGTETGTSYYIYINSSSSRISQLTLIYE